MGAFRSLIGSGRRNAGSIGRGLLGFFGTLIVWSILVGDWTLSSGTVEEVSIQRQEGSRATVSKGPVWPGWHHVEYMVAFGDSSTSTQFDWQGPRPTQDQPFGNRDAPKTKPQGEGPKWIEYLHSTYNQSRFQILNLAMAGSTIEPHYWEPRPQGQPPRLEKSSLKEQINLLRGSATIAKMKPFNEWKGDKSLFAMWFGVNEVVRSTHKGLRLPLDAMFATYQASLERLHRLGARNFLILNVPPIDTILPQPFPGFSSPPNDIEDLNAGIAKMARRMRRRHPDATVFVLDLHSLWSRTIRQPDMFPITAGLKATDSFCEGYSFGAPSLTEHTLGCDFARDEYFWEDDHRASHVVHRLTAATIAEDCFGVEGPKGFCAPLT